MIQLIDTNTIHGRAVRFGKPDSDNDVFDPGCLNRWFSEGRKGRAVKMLWAHDTEALPLGRWTEFEMQPSGLFVTGELCLTVGRAREVADIIEMDPELLSLSIGYRVRKVEPRNPGRMILDIDLAEISVVNFAAQDREPGVPDEHGEKVTTTDDIAQALADALAGRA